MSSENIPPARFFTRADLESDQAFTDAQNRQSSMSDEEIESADRAFRAQLEDFADSLQENREFVRLRGIVLELVEQDPGMVVTASTDSFIEVRPVDAMDVE